MKSEIRAKNSKGKEATSSELICMRKLVKMAKEQMKVFLWVGS